MYEYDVYMVFYSVWKIFFIGDNFLVLILKLVINLKLVDFGLDRYGLMVFIDVLGFFMVYYLVRIGKILNYLVVVLFFFYIYKRLVNYISKGR